mmetsp:Transcript_948/g.1694  ORF Transcript_948/g.1694 Transcript_948/m.1694 type:complete len:485 (+) Transcript_948:46-1500(+)
MSPTSTFLFLTVLGALSSPTDSFRVPSAPYVPSPIRFTVPQQTSQAIPASLSRRPVQFALQADAFAPADASAAAAPAPTTTTGLPTSTFNLIKACVGAGVLSLPAGVAAFSSSPAALVPASALMVTLGGLSAYSFNTIGKLSQHTNATSLSTIWESTVSPSAWPVSLACFLTPLGAALSYSIILGDATTSLAAAAGFSLARPYAILGLAGTALYRLCRLSDLSALAPVSIVGVMGILATTVFQGVRAFGPAYKAGGAFFSQLSSPPSFAPGVTFLSPQTLVLVSMAATAYLSHFNAPDFKRGLTDSTPGRFKKLTALGFGATSIISLLMMSFGFLTFGSSTLGVVLNNYAPSDLGAVVCRLLMAISIVGSYPFVFGGMKRGYFDLVKKEMTPARDRTFTRVALACITGLALALKDAGFVCSFNGAVCGSAIIYIFPSLMFLRSGMEGRRGEAGFNKFMIALGALFGVAGGAVSVMQSFFPAILG